VRRLLVLEQQEDPPRGPGPALSKNPKPPINNFARLDPFISDPKQTLNPALMGSSEAGLDAQQSLLRADLAHLRHPLERQQRAALH
jgi:hypothetical protein